MITATASDIIIIAIIIVIWLIWIGYIQFGYEKEMTGLQECRKAVMNKLNKHMEELDSAIDKSRTSRNAKDKPENSRQVKS